MTQIAQSNTCFAVVGAGSWGIVLAYLLASKGHQVRLWTRRETVLKSINMFHQHPHYGSALALPKTLSASTSLTAVVKGTSAVIWAIPSKASRELMAVLPKIPAFISCSKGIELASFKTMTEVFADYQPTTLRAALSGPNLARDIALGKPATATLASNDDAFARKAQAWFNQPNFRVYRSQDLKGIELAGAMKNIVALAAGMSDGLNLGDNAKASLVTRGLAEIIRLGQPMGAKVESFYGLAGLGDLIATCSSTQSRNHQVGVLFAQGKSFEEISKLKLTAEGIPTVEAVYKYAVEHHLDLPISKEVYQVIFKATSPQQAINNLMQRSPKKE